MSSKIYIKRNIEELYSLLTEVLTGRRNFDNENERYQKLRRRISALSSILGPLPQFLDTSDNLWTLWNTYIKSTLQSYESRRRFLKEKYKDYYDQLLNKIGTSSFEEEMIFRDIAIEEIIGEGGFGVVYKAEHIVLDELRAVKKLEPIFTDEEGEIKALRRFAREAKILSKLNHPNIVKVYDCGIAGENPYIVMEFIEGRNLEKCVNEDGFFEEQTALEIMKQVLAAISSAHSLGVVHRDIKPKNVMWDCKQAIVLDFGSGQWLEHTISTRMTTASVGTYGYIANELFENPTLLDKNLDCYSAGILFHYILTGHIPSTGKPQFYLEEEKIHKDVIDFILRSISPPNNRFKDGQEMLVVLENIIR
jgi:serine/threonine-protein kinase